VTQKFQVPFVQVEAVILRQIATACPLVEVLQEIVVALSVHVAAPTLVAVTDAKGVIETLQTVDLAADRLEVVKAFAETDNLPVAHYQHACGLAAGEDSRDYDPFAQVLSGQACCLYPVRDEHRLLAVLVAYVDPGLSSSLEPFATLVEIAVHADESAQQLKEARDKALKISQLKSEFLANMSHEIRTPMNGILGMLALFRETNMDAEQASYVDIAQSSGESLLGLIDDILDFSKIEAGQLTLEQVPFDFAGTVHEVVAQLEDKAEEDEIDLVCLIGEAVPHVVEGDPHRVRQVVMNLVGNALKFTEYGEVMVNVGVTQEDETGTVLRCEVTDTGVGIAPEAQKQIFAAFGQQDGSTTRKFGGTGLGLTISKQLVEKMGGKIGVISEVDRGSLFWFTVRVGRVDAPIADEPKAVAEPPPAEVPPPPVVVVPKAVPKVNVAPAPTAAPAEARVLIVEDNKINQKVALGLLKKVGLTADIANNGQEGVEALRNKAYDLIFMDCQMPVMDGYTATAKIREMEGLDRHTLIIAMTANAMKGDEEKCINSGMDDYLSKPVKVDKLRAKIAQWLPNLLETPE